jgi:sugar-specific transcriptional regulator TrmB
LTTEKTKTLLQQARKANVILTGRRDDKKADMKRKLEFLMRMGDGNFTEIPKTREELEAEWEKEMSKMKKQIQNSKKAMAFWLHRFEEWHKEVRQHHGEEVVTYLQDSHRHDHKDGNRHLLHALSRHYDDEQHKQHELIQRARTTDEEQLQLSMSTVREKTNFRRSSRDLTDFEMIKQVQSAAAFLHDEHKKNAILHHVMQATKNLDGSGRMAENDKADMEVLHNLLTDTKDAYHGHKLKVGGLEQTSIV